MEEFWKNNGDKILLGIIVSILTLLLSDPIKALLINLAKLIEQRIYLLGLGFQKRYFRALIESHRWLKLIGIYNPADFHAPRLQEVYISLRLTTTIDSSSLSWDTILNRNEKQIVILGQPGVGKSTLLDYLILIFTGSVNQPLRRRLGNPIPIFVRLRDLGRTGSDQNLLSLIESPENIGLKNIPYDYFERHLKKGNCIVLLDGLDEVSDEMSHKHVVHEIRSFANQYSDNWIIVTCRTAGWHNQLPNFRQYNMQEFDRDDVRQFVGAWYREVTRTEEINKLGAMPKPELIHEAEERADQVSLKQAENLWSVFLKNESLLRIARTPLILSLVTLVHKNRTTDLPKGRARLYRECLEILLDLWDAKDKGLTIPDSPSLNDKLLALKTIAYHYAENGLLEMDIEGLEQLVTPLLPSLTRAVSAKSLVRQIYERSGVLVEQAIGKYGFAHRALRDYLVASYIAEQNLDSLLVDHMGEEHWNEVILIAVGLVSPKRRAEALIEELLRQGDENVGRLALAGWSLAEDVQVPEELRNQVITRLIVKSNQSQNAEERLLITNVLMTTEYRDVVSYGNYFRVDPFRGSGMVVGEINELGLRITNYVPEAKIFKVEIVEPSAEYEVVSSNPITTRLTGFKDKEDVRFQIRVKAFKQIAVNYKVNDELQSPPIYITATKDNPYIYGKPAEGLAFLDRTNLTDQIIQAVSKTTKQDILVVGERRMGKTSLLLAINQKLTLPFVPVYVVLSENKPNTEVILKNILKQITNSLVEKGLVEENEVSEYHELEFKPALTEITKKARGKEIDTKVVLLVDEADHILDTLIDIHPIVKFMISLIGKQKLLIDNRLQNILRASLQSSDLDLRAVFVGTSLLMSTTSDYTSPLFNHFRVERLTTLSEQETRDLINKPAISLGYTIPNTVVDRIVNLSGGFPYYCQALCYEALQQAIQQNRSQISDQDMRFSEERVVNDLYKTSFLDGVWNRLSKQEKHCLVVLAQDEKYLNPKQLQRLMDWQIVVQKPDGYFIRSELIKKWVKMVTGRW